MNSGTSITGTILAINRKKSLTNTTWINLQRIMPRQKGYILHTSINITHSWNGKLKEMKNRLLVLETKEGLRAGEK